MAAEEAAVAAEEAATLHQWISGLRLRPKADAKTMMGDVGTDGIAAAATGAAAAAGSSSKLTQLADYVGRRFFWLSSHTSMPRLLMTLSTSWLPRFVATLIKLSRVN